MKRVGAPTLSPDGRWAVFSVTEPSYAEASQVSDLWLVATDGSAAPRRLTNTKSGESSVEWSPDGRKIAFGARREDDSTSQIYVLGILEGGEATRVTNVSTGASTPRWRPDGRAILFTSMIYPGAITDSANRSAAAERRGRKYVARVYESSPIRLWDRWLDERRPSLFIQPLELSAPAKDILAGSQLVAGAGFGGQLGSGGESISASWTPDGSGVVFAATTNRNESDFHDVSQALWLVSAARWRAPTHHIGRCRLRCAPFPSGWQSALRDHDAIQRAHLQQPSPRHVDLARIGCATGSHGWKRRSVDRGPSVPTVAVSFFSPRPRAIRSCTERRRTVERPAKSAASARERSAASAWKDPVRPRPSRRPGRAQSVPPRSAGSTLRQGNGPRSRASTPNALRAIDWQPLREFWFTSKQGKRIHSFVALPPGFDSTKKYPLFVLIHGGARQHVDATTLASAGTTICSASPGYVMLMTDYTGSTGYGERSRRRSSAIRSRAGQRNQ